MKKSIVLFLLIVAGAFQIAWGQEEPMDLDPCKTMLNPQFFFGAFAVDACPDCMIFWEGSYDAGGTGSFQILKVEIVGRTTGDDIRCENCISNSEIFKLAYLNMMEKLNDWDLWGLFNGHTTAMISPCWHEITIKMTDEEYQSKIDPPKPEPEMKMAQSSKGSEEILEAKYHNGVEISPCETETVCCKAKINVIFKLDDNYKNKVDKIVVLDHTFPPSCKDEDCQPLCGVLEFREYANRPKTNEQGTIDISVYPNPTNGELMINADGIGDSFTFELSDMLGNTVLTKQIENSDGPINMAIEAQPGVYNYRILFGTNIVKQGSITIIK